MKRLFLIIVTVFLNLGLFSCTPETILEQGTTTRACCGDDGDIPPPPPPPPPGDGD